VLQYVIAGLVLGGIYAITAAGLTVTYQSAGILNFSFGALAYFIARLYYFLHTQHGWGIAPAAVLSIVVAAPLIGVVLYALLFRLLRLSSPLIKVVATLGLSVTISPLATLLFGNQTILLAPGLAPEPVKVFRFLGVPVTMNQIIVYGCVIVIVVAGILVLRYTDIGLRVRAMVDSPAMTSLSGVNPTAVSIGVWAASTFLAGLAGVLSAPIIGLNPDEFTILMASAFAAVIAAKFRRLPVAVIVGLLMGVAGTVIPHYLPPDSALTAAVIPSIPLVVMAIFLVYYMLAPGRLSESEGVGGALDRAISAQQQELGASAISARGTSRRLGWGPSIGAFVVVACLPLILSSFWVGLIATGIAYGVLFLSFTLVTGEGGMVWLCMATFGGIGAIAAAQLATHHHWPVVLAVLAGGIVAVPFGIVIGLLTIRMGELYVALVTLTFGLLMENLVFTLGSFQNFGLGVSLTRPIFASTANGLTYLGLIVFAIVAVFIVNLRRSSSGMALTAVRWSEPASKTIGISSLQMKVTVAALAAFVAGIGGALLAVALGSALPANYDTLGGVIWLAVVVTVGIRSNVAALIAGLTFTVVPAVFSSYLPTSWGEVPPLLFGLGAITIAKFPEGTLALNARQLRQLVRKLRTPKGTTRQERQVDAALRSTGTNLASNSTTTVAR
jgi:branched-chain amino acid transport system permease protein